MRKLIVIANAQYVRNLVQAGAFDDIQDSETYWLPGDIGIELPSVQGTVLEPIALAPIRRETYADLRTLMLASYRRRSATQRIKLEHRQKKSRDLQKRARWWNVRREVPRTLAELGSNPELDAVMADVRPDILIAPSGGVDALVYDSIRSAHDAGIFTLALIFNWDNLSSKGAFPVRPDHLAVVGPQSIAHAKKIHRFRPSQVSLLGGPYIDHHFRHAAGSTKSPFDFRYVLFAGCYMPFDELAPLRKLEDFIEQRGLDLKVVYRPHPQRRSRDEPDLIDESQFRHVVIDPQVREGYLKHYGADPDWSRPLPELSYYPALLENAEFVICPLSTMVLESAIFERRVLVIAYPDGIHKDSPGVVVGYDHFQGMDQMRGLEMCLQADDLVPLFERLALNPPSFPGSMRDDITPWIFHDERPYSERLAELVDRLANEHDLGDGVVQVTAAAAGSNA